MKISTTWLKNWIDLKLNANELAQKLSLSGLEAASIEKAAGDFEKVVVGQIVECSQHPDADKLKICRVDVGEKENLQIICGAPNARQGIKVAVALMDAVLPGNFKIKKAKLRGVESFGMMCSTRELGLSDDHAGIIELESDAPVGKDFREYWQLDDVILDLEITPNRGDCLSLQGVAREIAAIENISFHPIKIKSIPVNISDTRKVILKATQKAPRYAGRTIKNINAKAKTPLYIQENLRRCGIRVIHPVVDVLNYVMLALGQPMHAFDLNCLKGNIIVRDAQLNEKIKLLDGSEILLQENTLVIADSEKPQAIAGVMGGEESGVTENTTDIFLESAFFVPEFISQAVRDYHLHSDSSYRFERGVDFNLQIEAMEYATQLLLEITGGKAGKIIEEISKKDLPEIKPIILCEEKIKRILGLEIPAQQVQKILTALGMEIKSANKNEWKVMPPSFRFDIEQEIDLIEELIRLYGYDKLPARAYQSILNTPTKTETSLTEKDFVKILVGRGYHEVITYSFVDEALQTLLTMDQQAIALANPLSHDMKVMRTSLLPGFVKTALYNQNRQIERVRLFETGLCFEGGETKILQTQKLGGLVMGFSKPENWSEKNRLIDFYDVKADVEALLTLTHRVNDFHWEKTEYPMLHPGQSAVLMDKETRVGYLGALHPALIGKLGLTTTAYVFEFSLLPLSQAVLPRAQVPSKFPAIRRDIAIIIDKAIKYDTIRQSVVSQTKGLLHDICVFDLYEGEPIEAGKKSIALNLTFLNDSRTLVEEEVNTAVEKIIAMLKKEFNATLRT